MNSVERRSIEKIIKGRFELLATELDELAQEYRASVNDEIEKQYAKELAAAASAQLQLRELADKLNAQADEVVTKLKAKGIEPSNRYGNTMVKVIEVTDHIEWAPTGMAKAKNEALMAINKRLNTAKNNLRREELNILESLHKTSIESSDAAVFLLDMPTAEDLMLKAAETKAIGKG